MTALPQLANGVTDLILICDQCGTSARANSTSLRDFAVVWNAAASVGWRGVARPVGPHYCPQCGQAKAV